MGQLVLSKMFQIIQNYFKRFLPNERKLSQNTIRSYRHTLETLLDFAKQELDIPLYELSFEKINRNMVLQYLQSLETSGCTASTRNQRLYAIQSFFRYAAREELDAVIFWDEIRKITPAKIYHSTVGYIYCIRCSYI